MNIGNKKKAPVDNYLLFIIPILVVFGLVMLFSASLAISQSNFGEPYHYVRGQLFGLVLGLFLFFVFFKIDYHFLKRHSFLFLILSVILLLLVFVPGLRNEYGTSYSWIIIFGKSFQVSEFVKLFFLFYLSGWLESK